MSEGIGQASESPYWNNLDTHQKLDQIFYYGQNDFQPVPNHCSVSVGDIIRLEGKRYRVEATGFAEVAELAPTVQGSLSGPGSATLNTARRSRRSGNRQHRLNGRNGVELRH